MKRNLPKETLAALVVMPALLLALTVTAVMAAGAAGSRPNDLNTAARSGRIQPDSLQAPLAGQAMRISQLYGGGGNTGAPLNADFVELFNGGCDPVTMNNWSVQYASAAGTTWQVAPITGTLQPGQYFLIQMSPTGAVGANLPTPDNIANPSILMSATSAKVALVNTATALTGQGLGDPSVVDFIGYGAASSCEGSAPGTCTTFAPTLSNTTAALRSNNGCADTDNNAADFTSVAPAPRNTGSTFAPCLCVTATPGPTNTPLASPTPTSTFTPAPTVPPNAVADVQLAKTDLPDPVNAGANLTYTLTATNAGPDAAGDLRITDTLPTNTRFVSATPSAGGSCGTLPAVGGTGTVVCSWQGATGANTTRTLTLIVRTCPDAACATSIANTATAGSTSIDTVPANNVATATTLVQTQSDLSILQTDAPDPATAGQTVTYTLSVVNFGPSNAAAVVVTDNLPPGTTFVSATASPSGTCTPVGNLVTCNLGTAGAANQCATSFPTNFTIVIVTRLGTTLVSTLTGCPGTLLSNPASVAASNCLADPNSANNSATAITGVRSGADVVVGTPLLEETAVQAQALVDVRDGKALGGDAEDADVAPDQDDCLGPGDFLRVTQTFGNTGPNAINAQGNNAGPEFVAALPANVVGVSGSCVVASGGGTCTITESQVTWDGAIPVGGSVTLSYRVRVKGGLRTGTVLSFTGQANFDGCNTGANAQSRTSAVAAIALDCAPTADPNGQLGGQVHLPILNFIGQDNVCETWVEIQNIGCDYAKAALVVWGAPGFCPPQAAGPLKVECTGLLKAGSAWTMLAAQIPRGAKSGILFKFTARQLYELGIDLGFDDVTADYMCETLFNGVVGNNDDYRRFKKAYNEGLEFAGIPLDLAAGGGFLAVDVYRKCPGDVTAAAMVTSAYNGIAGTHLGVYDADYGGYGYFAPLVNAGKNGMNTTLYIQNGGLECSSIEIWFRAQDDCLRATLCEIATLAPGETFQLDASDCVGPDWQGSAWVRSSAPMGIAVDIAGHDLLMTYIGEPAELNDTFDPTQATFTVGNQVLFGPLMYSEYQGWDSGVQVQNLSSSVAAKVKVYFFDKSGDIITTLVDWICPRGSQTFFLPVIAALPGSWVGSIRVESQEWWSPGAQNVDPPNIVAVASLIHYTDAARTASQEAIAYNLLPEHKALSWQIGSGAGGLESGVGMVAIPSLMKDLTLSGVSSEVAIANLVPKPGFTDFAIFIYDQNGLIDYVCEKLSEKQVEYIDLASWGYVGNRFKGSMIISATFWEHEVFDGTGFFLRNLVGLGAVAVQRTQARLGQDVPGDEAAGERGIPISLFGNPLELCPLAFSANKVTLCPGLPGSVRPKTDCTKTRLVVKCDDCPLDIQDSSTIGVQSLLKVNAPKGCTIQDVNVWMALEHTDLDDLSLVQLTSPQATTVELFSTICAGNVAGHFNVLFDDDATQRIGTLGTCPAEKFDRLNIENPQVLPNLTAFEGQNPTGTWQLYLRDSVAGDTGALLFWELQFELK